MRGRDEGAVEGADGAADVAGAVDDARGATRGRGGAAAVDEGVALARAGVETLSPFGCSVTTWILSSPRVTSSVTVAVSYPSRAIRSVCMPGSTGNSVGVGPKCAPFHSTSAPAGIVSTRSLAIAGAGCSDGVAAG